MTYARPARFVARVPDIPGGQGIVAGVCPEALAQLAGYRLPDRTVAALRRMVPARQLAAAKVMVGVGNCSGDFARALLAATPASQRADDPRGRRSDPERARRLAKMEKGLMHRQAEARSIACACNDDLYGLAQAASFVRGWMHDNVVRAWLQSHYPCNTIPLRQLVSASETATMPKRRMKLPYEPTHGSAGRRPR